MTRLTIVLLSLLLATPASATEAGWALLRNGGQVVLLNHANAPGSGDPANFDLENCRTQRNLSERGRHQARRMGALFAARAAPVEQVYSSRYCRARETADLAFGESSVEVEEALDLWPDDEDEAARAAHMAELMEIVADYSGSGNLVLVTHDTNVRAMAGVTPREGEAVIVGQQGDGLVPLGRIVFN